MKRLLAIASALIAYGSLYPFDFQVPHGAGARGFETLLFDPYETGRGDILGNVALFVPYGLAGVLAATRIRSVVARLTVVVLSGAGLALALQLAQLFLPSRDATLVDVFWNACGILAGVALAFTPPVRRLLSFEAGVVRIEVPFVLAGLWVATGLAPFLPSLDLQLVKASLKPFLQNPDLDVGEALLHFAAWLTALHFLCGAQPSAARRAMLSLLPLGVLAVQPFLLHNALHPHEVAGALGALVVWLAAGRFLRPELLAALLATGTILANLSPMDLRFVQGDFLWVPFTGFLRGSMVTNSVALLEKLFLYGSLVWLLAHTALGWGAGTVATAVVLAVQEGLQVFVRGATPEITDPLLAVLLALGMRIVSAPRSDPPPMPSRRSPSLLVARPPPATGPPAPILGVRYLDGLDGLRGIAALAVFAVHFDQTVGLTGSLGPFELDRLLENGNTGVALFFVLSGFLLSMPFWAAHCEADAAVDVRAYTARRLARIVPAYYVCLIAVIAGKAAFVGNWPSVSNVLSHAVFLHNLTDAHILSINPPFWTLAVEVQFYLLLPLVFLCLRPVPSGIAFALMVALSFGSYLANAALMSGLIARGRWPIDIALIWPFAVQISAPNSSVLEYSTLRHLTFFFMGAAAGWLRMRHDGGTQRSGTADAVFWVAAVVILVILSTPLDDVLRLPFGRYNWPVVPLLLAAMVLVVSRAPVARALLGWRPVRWVGLVSYGVYIYHYPIQKGIGRVMSLLQLPAREHWIVFGIASLLVTLLVAAASYRLLERPIMEVVRKRRAIARRTGPAPAGRAPGDWSSVSIGLPRGQLEQLHRVATERGESVSGATRYVIAEFMRGLERKDRDQARSAPIQAAAPERDPRAPPGRQPGLDQERVHRQVVNLRSQQAEFLGALSARLGVNLSRTVEMIVDAHIRERAARESMDG